MRSATFVSTSSSFFFVDLKRQVPGQVDVVFVFIHPDLCDPQGISPHGLAQIRHVGFVRPLDVGDPGAWNYLDTASTCPNLEIKEHTASYDVYIDINVYEYQHIT